jgi:NADH-quinone oxidoreductase subunit L
MWVPLAVLAVLALLGGAINLPFAHSTKLLEKWLEPVLEGNEHVLSFGGGALWVLAIVAVLVGLLGIAIAYAVYLRAKADPSRVEQPVLAHAWHLDEAVSWFMGGPGRKLFDLAALFDKTVIDGSVDGVGRAVRESGGLMRRLQNGFVRSYAVGVALGAVLLVGYFFVARAS